MNSMNNKQVVHDEFCWRCCGENTTLQCTKCVRSFHGNCTMRHGSELFDQDGWLCPVCDVLNEHTDWQKDKEVLPILIENVWNNASFDLLKTPLARCRGRPKHKLDKTKVNSSLIVNPVDLTLIHTKSTAYTSFNELYVDVCWIVHNCAVMFSATNRKSKAAQLLLNCITEEIPKIKLCSECYSNANKYPTNWFALVCDEPHLIIWAKHTDYNLMWPAKVMSADAQDVIIRYFGDHQQTTVPATVCLLYSESSPNRTNKPLALYSAAYKEANVYIENLEKKFGSFRYAEAKTTFNPAFLDHYLALLVPGVIEHRQNQSNSTADDQCHSVTSVKTEQFSEVSSSESGDRNEEEYQASSTCIKVHKFDDGNSTEIGNEIEAVNNVEISPKKCRLYDGDVIVID